MEKMCPKCGSKFDCGAFDSPVKECWCRKSMIEMPTLSLNSMRTEPWFGSCLCPTCLGRYLPPELKPIDADRI